jgi:mono/diheme cytochrome c family protein
MYTQNSTRTWDAASFFHDQLGMRHPVPGTVARDAPDGPVPQPAAIDAALLDRGKQRFDIFCTPCHGRAGAGDGIIVQRGFPQPPSLTSGDLRHADAKKFYDTITNGYGAMYSFADRVAPSDRWAIIAYIRALQLSQDAAVASLPQADRTRLEAAK